jgi:hypothetical protein
VSGFEDHCSVLVSVRIQAASAGCRDAVEVSAMVDAARIAVGSLALPGSGYPVDVQVYLQSDGADPLPGSDAVRMLPGVVAFEWCASASGSGAPQCETFGEAAATKWYVMPNRHPALPAAEERYDFGLDKVLAYASGQSSASAVAAAVNSGIAGEIYYDPGEAGVVPGVPPNHILWTYHWGQALCTYNAVLLEYLCEASGIGASVVFLWGSASTARYDCYFRHEAQEYYPATFRTPAPQYEGAPLNPHFIYHAITSAGGVFYDPSYGTVGLTVCDEVCPTYSWSGVGSDPHYPPDPNEPSYTPSQQQESQLPAYPQQALFVPYVCPH